MKVRVVGDSLKSWGKRLTKFSLATTGVTFCSFDSVTLWKVEEGERPIRGEARCHGLWGADTVTYRDEEGK